MMALAHKPVMLQETLEHLNLQAGAWYIDGTFGAGGHSRALLDRGVKVLAIDRDPEAARHAETLKDEIFIFSPGNFDELKDHIKRAGLNEVAGVLLDLGVSSMQLDEAARGFAFRQSGPLDMRMSQAGMSAADIVNTYSQEDLAALIYKYGEERYSRRIARAIVDARETTPFKTTDALVATIQQAYPGGYRRDHPARRSFQALRIAVNDELGALERALAQAADVLKPGGRLVVMSYHSLEDRIVKHTFRNDPRLKPLTKKPLRASEREQDENPRARSAKLRAAEKLEDVRETA